MDEKMTFELANSPWMYLMASIVVLFVLAGSIIFIFKSYKDAKEIGMDKSYIKKTIITSILFTLIPSISILIGVIALSGILGIPLPWIRLSVIGALHYEGAAVSAAYSDITMATMTKIEFATIAFVMTLGILSGPLFCLFGFKAYDKKILAKAREENNNDNESSDQPKETKEKKSFGPILCNAAFIAMICSFLAEDIAKLKYINAETPINSYVPLIVIVVSFLSMALFDLLEKKLKWKWLGNFSLGLSMIIGMASAVIFG